MSDKATEYKALVLVSKPVVLVRGAATAIAEKVVVAATKVKYILGIVSDKAMEHKALVIKVLQKYKSLTVKKFEPAIQMATLKLQAVAARLHLMELKDATLYKAHAVKNYMAATIEIVAGKAYFLATRVFSSKRLDYALGLRQATLFQRPHRNLLHGA